MIRFFIDVNNVKINIFVFNFLYKYLIYFLELELLKVYFFKVFLLIWLNLVLEKFC